MLSSVRPKVEILNREFVEKIINESSDVLEKTGVFVENAEARTLLRDAGATPDESGQRIRIARRLVEESLALTPRMITLFDRSGERAYVVGDDEVHYNPGSAAVKILDHATQSERMPKTEDLIRFCFLTENLPHIHFQSTALVSRDVPEILADSYRLFIGLQFCTKPVVTGTFRTKGFRPMLEMLLSVRGGAATLRQKPLAIFDACPSPPLKWSNLTSQSLIDCARAGIPSELISMGMTGATSPVTLAGTLVQHVAENMAGLVICQQANPGAPVIFGGSPSSFDLRKGTTPMGAIETMMIDMAYAQIGKYLKLPTHAYMGLSDAKINDPQAGFETGLGALLAALAGINVVSGPGMLDFESSFSLEKLAIDDEICGMAYRLLEGIIQREEPLAAGLFEGIAAGFQFLTSPHTRQWYRLEHTFPALADRDTYDAWVTAGKKSMAERASERVRAILAKGVQASVDEGLEKEFRRIMLADAKSNGVSKLPDFGL
jgi:trimethylamine--corrinoid protein Co-methyltransferase